MEDYFGEVNTLSAVEENCTWEVGQTIQLEELVRASTDGQVTFCTEQTEILSIDNLTATATVLSKGTAYLTATATDGGDTANILVSTTTFGNDLTALTEAIHAIGALDETNYQEKLSLIIVAERKLAAFDSAYPDQSSAVTNRQTLLDARAAYERIADEAARIQKQADIDEVIAAINAIGGVTSDNYTAKKEPIERAEALRDALSANYGEDILSSVTNLDTLASARTTYDTLVKQASFVWGDINGDKKADAQDALMALQHSVNLITLEGDALRLADVSMDGKVDASDALLILQHLVGLVNRFPSEQQ